MSTQPNIEGISVFVRIDGKVCLIPIAEESALPFVAICSAFQPGTPGSTRIVGLPESVVCHIAAAGDALRAAAEGIK